MTSTAQITRPRPAMSAEIVPLIAIVPFYGPPVGFLLVPWLLVGLLVAGPFACLLALVVAMMLVATVVAALIAALRAIVAAPSRIAGRVRDHHERHTSISAPVVARRVIA
jgi:hypothetical protein